MDSKNLIIICVTAIICLAIVAGVFVFMNNGSDDSTVSTDTATNDSVSTSQLKDSDESSKSSSAELGSIDNPKIGADTSDGSHGGELNPNYGDYYVIDGGLFRDDNQYLGGAGTYTFISGKNPYDGTSTGGDWYGKCTTHGWVKLDSEQHCPQCVDEGKDPRVLKNSKYQK